MKKIHAYSILFVFLFSGFRVVGQEAEKVDSSYENGYYKDRLAFFKQLPDRKNEIVFLGNSITEAGDWQEIYPGKPIVNRGISGDVSYGVYARLDEVLSSKPAKIFLLIGVNDIKRGTPLEYILYNYDRIIRKVKEVSPHTTLYLQSVLPVTENILASIYAKIRNEKIRELNEGLKALAVKYKLTYADLHNDVFKDGDGQLQRQLTTDGLHLKPAAYILWIDYLRRKKYL